MTEGLRRLKHLGGTLATVGSYSAEAGALYAAMGFTDYDLLERWQIEFSQSRSSGRSSRYSRYQLFIPFSISFLYL